MYNLTKALTLSFLLFSGEVFADDQKGCYADEICCYHISSSDFTCRPIQKNKGELSSKEDTNSECGPGEDRVNKSLCKDLPRRPKTSLAADEVLMEEVINEYLD